jgi:methyl-accepting chemotaxis protein
VPFHTTIATKIFLAKALLLLTLVTIAAIAIVTFGAYHDRAEGMRNASELAIIGERMNREVNAAIGETRGAYSSRSQDEIKIFAQNLQQQLGDLAADLQQWQALVPGNQGDALFDRVDGAAKDFTRLRGIIVGLAQSDGPATARREASSEENRNNVEVLAAAVNELVNRKRTEVQQLADELAGFYRQRITLMVLVALGGTILATAAAAVVVVAGVTRPLAVITRAVNAVAEGDVDMVVPHQNRSDEIGALARALDAFRRQGQEKRLLEAHQADHQRRTEAERRDMLAVLADNFSNRVRSVIAQSAEAAQTMCGNSQMLTANANQTVAQTTSASETAGAASENVETVAAAAEELSSSIKEIGRQVSDSLFIATGAVDQAARTSSMIRNLADAAAQIGSIVELINGVANKTNLLALNATIEAARAGDAGKGFAVVASEVKNLANQTSRSTSEIRIQVETIQAETSQAVSAVEEIAKTIEDLRQISQQVSTAVDQQGAATHEISQSAQEASAATSDTLSSIVIVNDNAENTRRAATEMLGAADGMADFMRHLDRQVAEFLRDLQNG